MDALNLHRIWYIIFHKCALVQYFWSLILGCQQKFVAQITYSGARAIDFRTISYAQQIRLHERTELSQSLIVITFVFLAAKCCAFAIAPAPKQPKYKAFNITHVYHVVTPNALRRLCAGARRISRSAGRGTCSHGDESWWFSTMAHWESMRYQNASSATGQTTLPLSCSQCVP